MFIFWNPVWSPVIHFPFSGAVTQEFLQEMHAELKKNREFISTAAQAILEAADQAGPETRLLKGPAIEKLRQLSANLDLQK